jgi:lysophospholipase L1-like esterase
MAPEEPAGAGGSSEPATGGTAGKAAPASGSAGTAGSGGFSGEGLGGAAGRVGAGGTFGGAAGSGTGGRSGTGGASDASGSSGGSSAGAAGFGAASSGGAAGAAGESSSGSSGTSSGGSGGSAPLGDITIWLAGDSTVANGNNCPIGWGQEFDTYFDDRVTVVNSAVGGRSVRTWLYNVGTTKDTDGECVLERGSDGEPTLQARWQAMLTGMTTGDYLFIQFGINDGSADCDRHVGLEAFKESYGMMALAAKERGAQPVFVTPVSSIACNGSTARGTRGSYVTTTIEAGTEFDVPVVDLHELSVALYDELSFCPIPGGSDVSASTGGEVGTFFCDDHTHFDRPGAVQIAGLVAQAVSDLGLGLTGYSTR